MNTTLNYTALKDLYVIEVDRLIDERGFFTETWNKKEFEKIGIDANFVQENHSRSKKNVLRGLHYQNINAPLIKLVRCVVGEILDVAVDLRINSATFGKWFGIQLSQENNKQLYIPIGFAHGFYVLSSFAEVIYKQTGYYSPQSEETIQWNDNNLAIDWKTSDPILSEKDKHGLTFSQYIQNPSFR